MDEGHSSPPGPPPRLLVYELDAVALELRQRPAEILDLESDVVEALAPFRQKLSDKKVGSSRLDELDARFPDPEHGGYNALLLYDLGLCGFGAEVLLVEPRGRLDVLHRITEVVDPVQHTSP